MPDARSLPRIAGAGAGMTEGKAKPAGLAAFDPFAATFEEAQRLQDTWATDGPEGPLFQWFEAQRLQAMRPLVEGGRGFDVLDAVAGCAWHGLVMPDWLARAYLRRFRQVQRLHVDSWDKAFDRPYPKNAQLGAMQRRQMQGLAVWSVVTEYAKRLPGKPMDALWQSFDSNEGEAVDLPTDIAREVRRIGCTRSTAQALYREVCKKRGWPDHNAIRGHAVKAGLPATSPKLAGRRKRP